MTARFTPGTVVQTPLGRGPILEVRNQRVLVRVQERAVLFDAGEVRAVSATAASARRASTSGTAPASGTAPTFGAAPAPDRSPGVPSCEGSAPGPAPRVTLDVHGLTVDQALDAVDTALNEALLRDVSELRVIHGRSSGRIRDALHRHLRGLSVVRTTRLDPANAGVTIILLA